MAVELVRISNPGSWLPAWVREFFSDAPQGVDVPEGAGSMTVCDSESTGELGWRLVSVTLDRATGLSARQLGAQTCQAYMGLHRVVASGSWEPVRYWAFIPQIHASMGGRLDRYMAFNTGRYDAFLRWLGEGDPHLSRVSTSTAVGHSGQDLLIYCLASKRPHLAVENPRQRPAYRYSERYGPRPPCFSRATLIELEGGSTLMVGGTASLRGEETQHADSLSAQLQETFLNLGSLIEAASDGKSRFESATEEVRAYVRNEGDLPEVEGEILQRLPGLKRLELMQATICRPELLVELECLVPI